MNLKNLRKDQLINKIQQIQKDNNNNKSLFSIIFNKLVNYKNWLLKLAIVSFLINLAKKYSLFRKIFRIISSLLLFIFGLSIYDFYDENLFYNILEFIRCSWIYEYFSALLTSKWMISKN
jgi:hypothetical protein